MPFKHDFAPGAGPSIAKGLKVTQCFQSGFPTVHRQPDRDGLRVFLSLPTERQLASDASAHADHETADVL